MQLGFEETVGPVSIARGAMLDRYSQSFERRTEPVVYSGSDAALFL